MSLAGKRIAIYARYSTDQQSEASIADQVHRCRRFVEDRGGAVREEHIFTDAAMSGTSIIRPAFEKLMAAARGRAVDVIVAEDMSRLSRDLADSATMFKELDYLCVPVIAVADGIDTSTRGAKMQVTLKSLMSDMFIEDLRDKTRRGLEGRARAGYSTGGLPIGYRSEPEKTPDGRVLGNRVVIDEPRAQVVRGIFASYLAGESHERIAKQLNRDQVEPARRGRYKHKGWTADTVRSVLHNEAYVGKWTFGRRRWVKVPGTNKRRPRVTSSDQWVVREYPDRRIIDKVTWAEVQMRLRAVRAFYTSGTERQMRTGLPGKRTTYPLSGLLRCGSCGGTMTIAGGSSASYYRCANNKKRGTCTNSLSVREDVARSKILAAVRTRITSPAAVAYLRKRLSEKLGELSRGLGAEVQERESRLERTKARLGKLVLALTEGVDSRTVRDAIKDLEAQREAEERAIDELNRQARTPVALPTPDDLVRRATDLERLLLGNPTRGREALAKLFVADGIALVPGQDGVYTARSTFFPLGVMALERELADAPSGPASAAWSTAAIGPAQPDVSAG